MEEKKTCGCSMEHTGKYKHRDDKEYKDLINRLNRIEGQIRGIKKMVEEERYCIDILNQVSAASSAMNSFSEKLLGNHIKSCVVNDIKNDNMDTVDELLKTIKKMIK